MSVGTAPAFCSLLVLLPTLSSWGFRGSLWNVLPSGPFLVIDFGLKTPLHFAAGKGHVEAVRVLMQAGADTSAETSKGQTPLLLANKPEVKAALSGEAPPLAPPLSPPASEAAAPSAAAATAAVATKERIEEKPSEEAGGTDRENQGSPGKPAAEGKGVGSGESQTAEHVAKGRGSAGGKAERAGSLAERRRKKRKLAEAAAAAGKGVSLDHLDGDE